MLILNCGGLLNSRYNSLNSKFEIPYDNLSIQEILKNVKIDYNLAGVVYKSSLDIDKDDRKRIANIIMESKDDAFIIIHGVDTINVTAEFLAEIFEDRKIILTDVFKPFEIDAVEASLNLGLAIGFIKANPKNGIYICMNGYIESWEKLIKNNKLGTFELVK